MAFTYYTPFAIASSQFAGSLTDFPVLISVTDNRFRTIANGGHVADTNGYDLRPYDNSGLSTGALSYQLVPGSYSASAGTFEMYVKVASATSGSSTIYLGYGDAALNTDGSNVAAWNSGYKGVWHLPNGSSLTAADGTTNANNGTAVNATATTGLVGVGGASFNGTTAEITCGTGGSLAITTLPITIEAWIKKTTGTGGGCYVARNDGGGGYCLLVEGSGTTLTVSKTGVFNVGFTTAVPADTNKHYIAVVMDGTTGISPWVDPPTNAPTKTPDGNTTAINAAASQFRIGHSDNFGSFFAGAIDEVRVSNVARSGDWILASYNNQNAPGTFAPTGTEVPVSGGSPKNLPPNFFQPSVL